MLSLPILIYNSQDTSRNFPALIPPGTQVTLLDWSTADLSTYNGPPPSSFPVAVLVVNLNGVPSPTMVGLLNNPANWSVVQAAMAASDNTNLLTSIIAYGSYEAGSPIDGPLVDLFNQTVIFDNNGLSPLALQQIPLLTPILANPDLGPTYWASLLKDPPSWLDAFTISYIENLSQTYQIPLQG